MKNIPEYVRYALSGAVSALVASSAWAGVPLNNLQGTGGIAFNPLAYTAGRAWDGGETNALNGIVSKPQVGEWYVNLTDTDINWFALGAAVTLFDRLEISGGYGAVNAHKYGDNAINTYNVGAKLRFLDENAFDTSWVPALAVGGVYKSTRTRRRSMRSALTTTASTATWSRPSS